MLALRLCVSAVNEPRMHNGRRSKPVFDVARDSLQLRFLFQLPERFFYPDHFTFADSVLYILDRGKKPKLLAVNVNDGTIMWRDDEGGQDAPTVAGDVAYYPGRGLIAVDKNTGREKWRVQLRSFYRPLYANGMLYAPDYESVVQIDAATGTIKRRFQARREVIGTPAIAGDLLLFGDLGGNLYAVRL